ncbi:MAG TPA: hypothetical protein VK923_19390 [Euzebyales bacterium]|nr:hypothetical protein [Euzebyales bacterium]
MRAAPRTVGVGDDVTVLPGDRSGQLGGQRACDGLEEQQQEDQQRNGATEQGEAARRAPYLGQVSSTRATLSRHSVVIS